MSMTPSLVSAAPTTPDRLPSKPEEEACVNCRMPLHGPYCTTCGERRASERDNSLRGFAGEVFQTVTSADRSVLGTLKLLLAHPGELTREFMRGRRIGLMRPLQLFLLVNVAFFLWSTATHNRMFDTPLVTHMHYTWHKSLATRMVSARIAARQTTLAAYARIFNDAATVQAKSLIVTMVPAFAILVGLVHIRRRRFALEHLVFALHTYAAMLILVVVTAYALVMPMLVVGRLTHTTAMNNQLFDNLFGLTLGLILGWYLRRALIRVYDDGKVFATVAAVGLFIGVGFILFAYRTLLFLTTFWAT
jgi:hypothetical protein